jgi:hypothetical protein
MFLCSFQLSTSQQVCCQEVSQCILWSEACGLQSRAVGESQEDILLHITESNFLALLFSFFLTCLALFQQLTIKEYIMKIFPKRLFTFRVCPSTKVSNASIGWAHWWKDLIFLQFQFLGLDRHYDTPTLLIEDGCQPPVEITSKDRDVIASVFTIFLLKNIGMYLKYIFIAFWLNCCQILIKSPI